MDLETEVTELRAKFDRLLERGLADVCPMNYTSPREHKWQWVGTNYQHLGAYWSSSEIKRAGVHRTCRYCCADDWNVELHVQLVEPPKLKVGDKAAWIVDKYEDRDDMTDKTPRVVIGKQTYYGEVTQLWLEGDWRTKELQYRCNFLTAERPSDPFTPPIDELILLSPPV